MNDSRNITVGQATTILISTIIGVGVLALPLFAVRGADSGAPLVTLLGTMLAFVGMVFVSLLGMRFPNQSIIQYSEDIIGRWLAWIGSALAIAFFAILSALIAREFGEVVITAVLKNTPLEVTVLVVLIMAAVSSRKNLTTFAYIHYFYSPLLLFPVLIIVVLSLKNAEVINLLPIWGNNPSGMLEGVLTTAALYQGAFVLTMVIPAMSKPQSALRVSIRGILITGTLYVAIVIASVSVFGAEETKKLLWPTLELAKATSLPANILERLDAAFLAVWVTAVFTTLFSSYYFTIRSISQLFRLTDHRMLSYFVLPIVFILAMLPRNILEMYDIIQIVGRIGLLITIAYPGALLLIAMMRRKRGDTA